MTIVVPLSDILIDPEREVDLVSLPKEQAVELIKKFYGFLSSAIDVSIEDGIATITFLEKKAAQAQKGLDFFREGIKEAEKGKYSRAIQFFKEAVEILPNHTEARRNLAMAFMEAGNSDEAKNHLIDVLRLDPKDVWGYLLLGNIYAKHEENFDVAEKFYLKAYELSPKDSYLLNNYAALMMERKNYKEAQDLFNKAITIDPKYPNSYFGLALSYHQEGRHDIALLTLDDLFSNASREDLRSEPVFDQARKLYFDTNIAIAQKNLSLTTSWVEERKKVLEESGSYPIRIIEDNTLEYVVARTQMAWKHKRDYHEIRYRKKNPFAMPHILSHEMEHIHLEAEARKLNRNRIFMTTPELRENAIRSVSDHIHKLKTMDYSDEIISKVMLDIVNGLSNQLFNCPLDMIIEKTLLEKFDVLRPSQFISVFNFQDENLKVLTSQEIRKLTPPLIYRANISMNCAYALCIDHLYNGRTSYSIPYKKSEAYNTGKKLFEQWLETQKSFRHGDEYLLVDEFARILKLQEWYQWLPDEVANGSQEGVTNPELLKQKEPASVMYCLGALQRYENMSREDVLKIAGEIALLGQSGIDYTKPDQRYSLQSIPGEQFSGLQLMCLMYVGFQKINPTMDVGMDLKSSYELALTMYGTNK